MRPTWFSALLCLPVFALRPSHQEPDLEQVLKGNETSTDPTEAEAGPDDSSSGTQIELRVDQSHGVHLEQSWGTGTWVYPAENGSLLRKMENMSHPSRFSSVEVDRIKYMDQDGKYQDVHLYHAPKTLVAKKWWEVLKKGKKNSNYTVELIDGGAIEGKFVIIPFFFGIAPTILTAFVSLCLLPRFIFELCGLCGQTALAAESHATQPFTPAEQAPPSATPVPSVGTHQPGAPAGPPPTTASPAPEDGAANRASKSKVDANPEDFVLRLKQTLLTHILDSKMVSLSLLLFSLSMCIGRLIELCYIYKLVAGEPVLAAADYTLPAVNLGLCLAVILGSRAARETQAKLPVAAGAWPDLKAALQKEWRKTVLLPFGLKLLVVLGLTWFLLLALPHDVLVTGPSRFFGVDRGLVAAAMRWAPYIDICCHQGLLFIMMLKFMLDAFIVARVVVAHVDAVTDALKQPFDKVDLKQIHVSCVKLAGKTLPKLATISGPTCGVAVLTWSYAFVVLLQEALTGAATASDQACFIFAVIIFCHLPIGLACLLLPAEVSDACERLMKQLNQLRVETDLEKHKQICLTEAFIKESNQGQGLGFILYPTGMVVNKRIILTAGAKLLGSASILFSFVWKLCEIQQSATRSLANTDS